MISTGVIPVEFHQLGYQLEINGFQLFQNPVGLTGNRISNRKILTGISFWVPPPPPPICNTSAASRSKEVLQRAHPQLMAQTHKHTNTHALIYCISHYFRVQLFSRFWTRCSNSRVVNFAIFLMLSLL